MKLANVEIRVYEKTFRKKHIYDLLIKETKSILKLSRSLSKKCSYVTSF